MNKSIGEAAALLNKKIEESDAVLVGAAAGMSAACGYNYFYDNDEYFKNISVISTKNMDLSALLTVSIILMKRLKNVGHFLRE